MENQEMLEEFDALATDESITTEQLDEQVKEMAILKAKYDSLKTESTMAHEKYQYARATLISLLKKANKTKYHVDGIGTVSVTEKLKVQTPKAFEDKEAFFAWLRERGENEFLANASVNYQSLQRIYNEAFEEAKNNGTASDFSIPGLNQPDVEYGLSFRK